MSASRASPKAALSPAHFLIAGVLALMAGFYAFAAMHVHWTGARWWERAAYETAQGHNVYIMDYQIWVTHSEAEPFFGYGAGSLYVAVPLFLLAQQITGDATPDLFAQVCVVWAAAAHMGLVLLGAQLVWQQSHSHGAAAATAALLGCNPILLTLGAMGDIVDITMLALCALYLRSVTQGRFCRAGIWLSLAFVVKQFPLLLFPDFFLRAGRARRWDAVAWSLVPLVGLSLPFLIWSPREYLFILAGNVNAWRPIYAGEWWNVFAYLATTGVPEGWVRALSLSLLACAVALIYWASWRKRLNVLVTTALLANAFWMLYYSSMATYIGWGAVFATIALGSAWGASHET